MKGSLWDVRPSQLHPSPLLLPRGLKLVKIWLEITRIQFGFPSSAQERDWEHLLSCEHQREQPLNSVVPGSRGRDGHTGHPRAGSVLPAPARLPVSCLERPRELFPCGHPRRAAPLRGRAPRAVSRQRSRALGKVLCGWLRFQWATQELEGFQLPPGPLSWLDVPDATSSPCITVAAVI